MKTPVRSRLDQPGPQRLWFAQLWKFREQGETDFLKDFVGVLGTKSILDGNGKYQVLVFVNEFRPSLLISFEALPHQLIVAE